jgi:hypothetical protein
MIKPDKLPSSAIHATSAKGTTISRYGTAALRFSPVCRSALAFVVLRIKVAINRKRYQGKITLLYRITVTAENSSIGLERS